MKHITSIIAGCALAFACAQVQAQSVKENFDFGWKFRLAEESTLSTEMFVPEYDDAAWQSVDLPHDWSIYNAPYADAPMGNDGGYYPAGFGIYRKVFTAPMIEKGYSYRLHFEGVYQKSVVMVNGTHVSAHMYGYTPFHVDVTRFLKPGQKNAVTVLVDNVDQPNCRWYSGSGIYRHVWFETYKADAVDDPLKLFITTEKLEGISADGTKAAKASVRISYEGREDEVRTYTDVDLWSPEHPVLYDIKVGELTVKHGFRTFTYNTDGFFLNGISVKLNGACMHHDDGILGAMAFDAAEIRKVRLMKEAGFNLIRTSHNPQTRAMLDACDSLGMLVLDEAFDGWYDQKTAYDYHLYIDKDYKDDLTAMVLRDRNHPCIICWSIGNEVIERKELRIVQSAKKFKAVIKELDPTRPVTEALCTWDNDWEIFDPHAEVLDIVGYNYMMHKAESDHERCPDRVMWQTESYPRDAFRNWKHTVETPYILGDMVWTGLDYLGESGIGQFYYDGEPAGEHYQGKHFPFHGAYCGDVDITGWRKPISHYRDMLFNWTDGDASQIYMAVREPDNFLGGKIRTTAWGVWPTWESWNWSGYEGRPITVEVYTKAPSVSLYLDGKLIGTKQVSINTQYKAVFEMPYQPGTLRAVASDSNGNEGASCTLATSGEPYSIRLTPEQKKIKADAQDLAYIVLEVVDRKGNVVPDASVPVDITVSGAGKFLAAGSASLKDLEPTTTTRVTTYKGRALVVVRSSEKKGTITVQAKSALKTGTAKIISQK